MRIVQLIDSLEAGGAERMAVNYANSLSERIDFSGLVVTRSEGILKDQLETNVPYLFLDRKKKIDVKAVLRLRHFIKVNGVSIVHAHSTSFFVGCMLKVLLPSIKIIWHDHYGNSELLDQRKFMVLKYCSFFFEGIISVNQLLQTWAIDHLLCKRVVYLENFVSLKLSGHKVTILNGIQGKRIVCLANLREQKNHFLLLDVAEKLKEFYPDWTFHFVGKDFYDEYSTKLKEAIATRELSDKFFLYGSREDISYVLEQATLTVISSDSEGLPVALLEYGYCGKCTLSTAVGQIPMVITDEHDGLLCERGNVNQFYERLELLINDEMLRNRLAMNLKKTILDRYTDVAVLKIYLEFIKTIS